MEDGHGGTGRHWLALGGTKVVEVGTVSKGTKVGIVKLKSKKEN